VSRYPRRNLDLGQRSVQAQIPVDLYNKLQPLLRAAGYGSLRELATELLTEWGKAEASSPRWLKYVEAMQREAQAAAALRDLPTSGPDEQGETGGLGHEDIDGRGGSEFPGREDLGDRDRP
jgi:hypothetical protein